MGDSAFQDALVTALRRLKTSDRLESEVRAALIRFPVEVVDAVVLHLRSRKFIDDMRVVSRTVEANSGRRAVGDALLADRLTQRGADERLVAERLQSAEDEATRIDTLLKSKYLPTDDFRKAARFLGGRGFSEDAIASGLERYFVTIDPFGWSGEPS